MDCHHFVTDGYHKFLEGLEARHDFCNLVIVFHAKFIASTRHASQLLFPGTWFMQLDMRKTDVNSVGSKYTVQHITGASTLIFVLEDKSAHRVRQ